MNPVRSSGECKLDPAAPSGAIVHARRVGKTPAKTKVFVADLLREVMASRGIDWPRVAKDLGIARKTVDGLLRPVDPRPGTTAPPIVGIAA